MILFSPLGLVHRRDFASEDSIPLQASDDRCDSASVFCGPSYEYCRNSYVAGGSDIADSLTRNSLRVSDASIPTFLRVRDCHLLSIQYHDLMTAADSDDNGLIHRN